MAHPFVVWMVTGTSWPTTIRAGIVVTLLIVPWLILWWADPPYSVLVHMYYLPVMLAAIWLGFPSAAIVATVSGLLAGPLSPPSTDPATPEPYAWIIRLAFYLLVARLSSGAVRELRERRTQVQDMYESLTRLYTNTLRGFSLALELKDEETHAHCERVAANALLVGRRLGLSPDQCEALYWSGYLHDIGKLATPIGILTKPGSLTDEEFATVKEHTVKGEALLERVSPSFSQIALGVRYHH